MEGHECWEKKQLCMNTTQEKTKSFWSQSFLARVYRTFSGRHYLRMHTEVGTLIAERHPEEVLDIACGPGSFLSHISDMLPKTHLTGTDMAPGMLKYAREKLRDKAKIIEVEGVSQSFAKESFDVVTIMMAFHHFPKKEEALRRISRLLKPSGLLIIADVVAGSVTQKKVLEFCRTFCRHTRAY